MMKVVAFLTGYSVVDRIINHLKLTSVAERPPPPQEAILAQSIWGLLRRFS
jgi:hypothetical protein